MYVVKSGHGFVRNPDTLEMIGQCGGDDYYTLSIAVNAAWLEYSEARELAKRMENKGMKVEILQLRIGNPPKEIERFQPSTEPNPVTMNKLTFEQLDSQTARLNRIIYLAGMANDTQALPPDLEVLIEDSTYHELQDLFGIDSKELENCVDEYGEETLREHIVEELHRTNRLGFLLQIATPIMKRTATGRGRSFSWGYYSTKWVYGETLDAAIEVGLKWVTSRREREDADFEASQKEESHGN